MYECMYVCPVCMYVCPVCMHVRYVCMVCMYVCMYVGGFDHAFELARLSAAKKLPEVHLKHAMYLEDEERFKEVGSMMTMMMMIMWGPSDDDDDDVGGGGGRGI